MKFAFLDLQQVRDKYFTQGSFLKVKVSQNFFILSYIYNRLLVNTEETKASSELLITCSHNSVFRPLSAKNLVKVVKRTIWAEIYANRN